MTHEDTIDSLEVVDSVIRTLEFNHSHFISGDDFMPIYSEKDVNEMICQLLCLRRRLSADVEKINKLKQNYEN